jgi:hypothetical protein
MLMNINGKMLDIGPFSDLSGADLSGANLTGADLSNANLVNANLSSADLSGANLTGAAFTTTVLEDAADAFTWETIARTYDAADVALSEAITYDDGREEITTFTDGVRSRYLIEDLGEVFAWDSIERTYDAEGRKLQQIRTNYDDRIDTTNYGAEGVTLSMDRSYDDGREEITTFTNGVRSTYFIEDLGEVFAWESIERTYDAEGRKLQQIRTNDEGRDDTTKYDAEGRKLQEIRSNDNGRDDTTEYDSEGVTLSKAITYTDGREALTTFTDGVRSTYLIEDLGEVFAWESIERTYDAEGRNLQQIRTNDDDRTDTTTFTDGVRSTYLTEDLGGVFTWDSIARTYDAEGRNLQQIRTDDDGRTDTTEYDVAGMTLSQSIAYADGRKSLSTFTDGRADTTEYDTEGVTLSHAITYNDGREALTTFTDGVRYTYLIEDSADAFAWESVGRAYDAAGRNLQEVRINDDGRTFVSDFLEGSRSQTVATDVENVRNWSSYTDTFNEEGDRVSRTMTYDDGSATLGEDDISVLINVSGSVVDTSDSLTFEILDAPTDANGNQYGSVENNGDGTFTFLTGDNFQFLDTGETREMTFNYVVIDGSGTATDTSVAQTATITVTGADDARLSLTPLSGNDTFLFSTADQSIFEAGDASVKNPTLPFLGGSWDESFSIELIASASEGIPGTPSTPALVILGETIIPSIPGIPGITVSSPSLSLIGSSSGTIGLQPFFSMTGGDIDATIPIGASFDVPRQVETGETFVLGSTFLFGDDTNISTQSAEIEFGVDLVLELAAQMSIDYSSSSLGGGGSFNIIPSFDLSERFNIFTINSGDVGGEIPLSLAFRSIPEIDDFLTLSVAVPNVTTTGGFSEYGPGYDVGPITSSGGGEIASLSVDIDAIIAEGLSTLTGSYAVPVVLGFAASHGLEFDAGLLGDFNLASFDITADLLYSDLTTKISLLQNFSLELEDLPLMMILEDGSEITGRSLGDEITVTAPIGFDADVDGDADGFIDFTIDVDMDAVLTTMVSLGFDTTFTLGALRAAGSATSDIFPDFSFNAFEGGAAGLDDDFLYYESEDLANETVVVFENTFDLVGFEPLSTDTITESFDVA